MNIGNAAVEARKSDIIMEHAKDFLEQYFTSIKRWALVQYNISLSRILPYMNLIPNLNFEAPFYEIY